MEKYILSWDSGKKDETAVVITRIDTENGKANAEVVFCGVGNGAICIDEFIASKYKDFIVSDRAKKERTIKKVEDALGIKLFDWQKEYLLDDVMYGREIQYARRAGKTLTHCLKVCLSNGEPIKARLEPACTAKNEFLRYLGEDGCTYHRSQYFISELKEIYTKLKDYGGIELREITF